MRGNKRSLTFLVHGQKEIFKKEKKTNYSALRQATFYNKNKIGARAA
jgi:hypothetical protein